MKIILTYFILFIPIFCNSQSYFSKAYNHAEDEWDYALEAHLIDSLYYIRDEGTFPCNSNCTLISVFDKDGELLRSNNFQLRTLPISSARLVVNKEDSLFLFSYGGGNELEMIKINKDLDSLDSKSYDIPLLENQTSMAFGGYSLSDNYLFGTGIAVVDQDSINKFYGTITRFRKDNFELDTVAYFSFEDYETTLFFQSEVDEEENIYVYFQARTLSIYKIHGFVKFDKDLNLLYYREIPTSPITTANGLLLHLPNGNTVLSDRTDISNPFEANAASDIPALHCLDEEGNTIWRDLEYVGWETTTVYSHGNMTLTQDENILLVSTYIEFDDLGTITLGGGRLRKLTFEGEVLWDRLYGLTNEEGNYVNDSFLHGVIEEPNGDIFMHGRTTADTNSFAHWLIRTDSNGCIEENCDVSSIDLLARQEQTYFKLKQNPVEGEIMIEIKDVWSAKDAVFKIYSLEGQLLTSYRLDNLEDSVSIPFNEFNSGMYFISLVNSEGILQSEKVIKL